MAASTCRSGKHILSKDSDWVRRNDDKRQCRECWKEAHRRGQYRRQYGITIEEYDEMLEAQNYRCAICRDKDPGGRSSRFHIDHDHVTGEVRGLLCVNCNNGLGRFKDDLLVLREAIRYLEGE